MVRVLVKVAGGIGKAFKRKDQWGKPGNRVAGSNAGFYKNTMVRITC